jgi:hypothetical protein
MQNISNLLINFRVYVSITIAVLLILTGCSKDSTTGTNPTASDDTTPTFVIDTVAQNGEYPAIAIDKNGKPYISYLDFNDEYVKYAVKNDTSWIIRSVGYAANANGTLANGGLSSIALDATNNPHITYYDYGNVQFKYAKFNGTTWTNNIIPLPKDSRGYDYIPWAECSIAIDTITGNAHVSLQMLGSIDYALGYWKTGLLNTVVVDRADSNTGYQNSIALDGNGYPHISYEARSAGKLKYANWTGSTFNIENVDSTVNIYWEDRLSSLAIDPSGNPHIAYVSAKDGYKYKYAHKSGALWSKETFSDNYNYPSVSLAIDGSGKPHIALVDISSRLRYGYWNGSAWSFTTLDNNVNRCAIKVDKSGKVHIVYNQGNVSSVIKYASK